MDTQPNSERDDKHDNELALTRPYFLPQTGKIAASLLLGGIVLGILGFVIAFKRKKD